MPLLLTLVCSLTATPGVAQDPLEQWRQQNDHGDRFESTDSPRLVGLAPLALVSFFAWKERFDPTDKTIDLTVSYYVGSKTDIVRLWAQGTTPTSRYRMEAKAPTGNIGWNAFGQWRTGDVLAGAKLPWERLGVLVRFDRLDSDSGTVAPAFLYQSKSKAPEKPAGYSATFITSFPVGRATYTVVKGCTGAAAQTSGTVLPPVTVANKTERTPFLVEFALPDTVSESQVELQISAWRPGQKPGAAAEATRRFCFTHLKTGPGLTTG